MRLYHHINGSWAANESTVKNILKDGLQANRGQWVRINELLPQRPQGIFFWGRDNIERDIEFGITADLVSVDSDDLDTSKLWAFPADAAYAANLATEGQELIPEAYDFMAQAKPVPFSEFQNQFAAEWIYTENIPGSIISKEM